MCVKESTMAFSVGRAKNEESEGRERTRALARKPGQELLNIKVSKFRSASEVHLKT